MQSDLAERLLLMTPIAQRYYKELIQLYRDIKHPISLLLLEDIIKYEGCLYIMNDRLYEAKYHDKLDMNLLFQEEFIKRSDNFKIIIEGIDDNDDTEITNISSLDLSNYCCCYVIDNDILYIYFESFEEIDHTCNIIHHTNDMMSTIPFSTETLELFQKR